QFLLKLCQVAISKSRFAFSTVVSVSLSAEFWRPSPLILGAIPQVDWHPSIHLNSTTSTEPKAVHDVIRLGSSRV
ncbi:hypothetical protein AVEN_7821-1, partial [Araneus ventricosus]